MQDARISPAEKFLGLLCLSHISPFFCEKIIYSLVVLCDERIFPMDKKQQGYVFTIPNLLSVFRLMLIPLFVFLYSRKHLPLHGCIVLIISGFTDILDGYIARNFNMVSNLGKILDPVADKLTQCATLICLTASHPVMLLPLSILFVKESLGAVLCLLAIKRSGQVQSSHWHGKLNTVFLYIVLALHLVWLDIPRFFSFLVVCISCLMMLFSFALYTMANISVLIKESKLR